MEDPTYTQFQRVARSIEAGWTWRAWETLQGDDKCLVQGLRNEFGFRAPYAITAVDNYLHRHSYFYRFITGSPTARLVRWNDLWWRQQEQVVALLDAVAAEHEMEWLRDERFRLSIEMSSLREQIVELQARVSKLEAENSKLAADNRSLRSRIARSFDAGYKAHRQDQETLAQLEAELDTAARHMQELDIRSE